MRVALIVPNFPPEFTGGTEQVARALARALVATGVEVLVVSGSDQAHDGRDVVWEEIDGVRVARVRRTADEGYGLDIERPRILAVLDGLYAAEGIDVVHAHHWSTLSDRMVRRARAAGCRVVVTLHDLWSTCPRFFRSAPDGITCPTGAGRDACGPCAAAGLAMPVDWCHEHLALRDIELHAELAAAHALTVPSQTTARRLATHLPWDESAFEVVPHGLLAPVGEHEAIAAADPSVLRVGTFGNLVEPKGVMLLVYACRGIANLELHLHGPFLEPAFEDLVRAKAAEFGVALTCHGRYAPEGPHPARGLDVAVFPSLCEETYGLVVEEALARQVPVIVSDRGALHERIGQAGLQVAVDEVGPLQQALQSLTRDRAQLTTLRAAIPREFATIRDAAARYRDLYSCTSNSV